MSWDSTRPFVGAVDEHGDVRDGTAQPEPFEACSVGSEYPSPS